MLLNILKVCRIGERGEVSEGVDNEVNRDMREDIDGVIDSEVICAQDICLFDKGGEGVRCNRSRGFRFLCMAITNIAMRFNVAKRFGRATSTCKCFSFCYTRDFDLLLFFAMRAAFLSTSFLHDLRILEYLVTT